jgi:5'-methylthioadenosine phosphorylase
VPYRANVFALKKVGATCILASGACGSLREHIRPCDVVVVDQVIDRTTQRAATFFDGGLAVHVEMAEPMCPDLRRLLTASADGIGTTMHPRGVYLCMEGPQFSTAAESHMHRAWGADLVGMTCMPEAKLAREAEMCYALLALPTDYDAWRPHDPRRSRQALLEEIGQNLQRVCDQGLRLLKDAIARLDPAAAGECNCRQALALAIWSQRPAIDLQRLRPLRLLLDKYLKLE